MLRCSAPDAPPCAPSALAVYEDPERTILDAGEAWIAQHADAHAALKAALADGALMKRARALTYDWQRAAENRVEELRRSEGIRIDMASGHVQRTAVGVLRALVTRHSTFATFLSEPLDGLQRWQMFMILVTLVISQLLVNIWMCVCRQLACVPPRRRD